MHKLTFQFGANVYGRNKHCGQLAKVVVEPHTWQLSDLIIEDGWLFKRAVVLPVSQVRDTLEQTINLKITNKQMGEFQAYGETTIEKGVADWPATKAVGEIENMSLPAANIPNLAMTRKKTRLGVSNDAIILDSNTNVTGLDRHLGHLSHVIVDARDYSINNLVFTQDTLFPKSYVVPASCVDSLAETQTQIAKTRSEAEQLPEYIFLHNS